MDIGRAFGYITEDEDWIKKVLIAGLIGFVPLLGLYVVYGWGLEIVRRTVQGEAEPIPAPQEDLVAYLTKGFIGSIIGFVYLLPVILLVGIAQGVSVLAAGGNIGGDAAATAVLVVSLCFSCVALIYALIASPLIFSATSRYAVSGEFGSAFQVREVIASVRAALIPYLIASLLAAVIVGIAEIVGLLLCGIGITFTLAYAAAVNANLQAQVYELGEGGQSA
jgi:hypothetical protein